MFLPVSGEHHRLASVDQNAILQVVGDSPCEHAALYVTPLPHEIVGGVGVGNMFNVLADDGTFIEVLGDVMCGGTDDLDATVMGLVVRLCTLEAGKEGVMNINAAPGKIGREVVGKDLHVTGKDDQLCTSVFYHPLDLLLLLLFCLLGDRKVVVRNPVMLRHV